MQALLEKHQPDVNTATERNQPFYNMVCNLPVYFLFA